MVTMNSNAKQIDNHFGNKIAGSGSATDSRIKARIESRIDPVGSAQAPGGAVPFGETFLSSTIGKLICSPNLRAAVAIGFFLAYLATAIT